MDDDLVKTARDIGICLGDQVSPNLKKGKNNMKDFKQIIAEEIEIATNINKEKILENIGVPKDTSNGDYAFPCFILAKELKKSPVAIAEEIKEKISQNLEIQLMREKYIDKNAIGIVGWAECDYKIQNNQMIAGLKMAASV